MELASASMQETVESLTESALDNFSPDDLVGPNSMKDVSSIATDTGRFDPDKLLDSQESGTELDSTKGENFDPDNQVGSVDGSADSLGETSPGRHLFLDDSGSVYRIDDELVPNNEYIINGYEYRTDGLGRITSAEGQVVLRERDKGRIKDDMGVIGKGSQFETDDRGHLIAGRFNGSGGMENLVPMNRVLNRAGGGYYKLEERLADAACDGCDVRYKVEPRYSDDSRRPSSFIVTDVIDGETTMTIFKNEGTANRA